MLEYISLSDSDGNLKNVDEIIDELKNTLSGFNTTAMSIDRTNFLAGKKAMLSEIIEWMERISYVEK